MALPPVTSRLPTVTTPGASSPRAEAVRAAQRAFFETALAGEMSAASSARPTTPAAAPTAATPLREVRAVVDPEASAPPRPLRPGSLLDIKV